VDQSKIAFWGSLRSKLVAVFLLITLLPMAVLAFIGLNRYSGTLTEEIRSSYKSEARAVFDKLKLYITHGHKTVENIAGAPSLRECIKNAALEAEKMKLTAMDVDQIEALMQGRNWAVPGSGEVRRYLQERVKASEGQFSEFFVTDKYGNTVAASGQTSDFVQSDEDWWRQAFKKGRYIGGVEFDESAGTYSVRMAVAVKDFDGTPIGVLSGAYNFVPLLDAIGSAVADLKGSNAILVNYDGVLLADTASGNEGILRRNLLEEKNLLIKEIFEKKEAKGSLVASNGDKGNYVAGFVKEEDICGFENLDWTFAMSVPAQTVLAPVIKMRQTVYILGIIFAAAVIVLGNVIIGRMSKPITLLTQDAMRISEGDLSKGASLVRDGNDEISILTQSFARMVNNVRNIVIRAKEAADKVAGAVHELSASAEENTRGTEEIASTIQEISTAADKQSGDVKEVLNIINKRSEFIQQLATNAKAVSSSANEATEKAESGNKSIATAVRQMHSINRVVENSAKEVFELGERSKHIGQIVNTITDIAEQTNLLALNAAIEAARAGEQGRGFAVVAEEVRKLAEESSRAAEEISQLIKEIQDETSEAVKAIESGTEEVQTGMKVMGEAGKAFQQIRKAIKHISEQARMSSEAAQELDEGSRQIVEAMEAVVSFAQEVASSTQNVAAVTEEQTASMEEITSSANALSELAEELRQFLSDFQTGEGQYEGYSSEDSEEKDDDRNRINSKEEHFQKEKEF